MLLFIDTETTGKYNFDLPPADESQPRIIEVAAIATTDQFELLNSFSFIIKPTINFPEKYAEEAVKLHGITEEKAEKYGVFPGLVYPQLFAFMAQADKIIAHNARHEVLMLKSEIAKMHAPCPFQIFEDKFFCTMLHFSKNYKLPGKWAGKWPTLQEMHLHLLKEPFEAAHRAYPDTVSVWRCYQKMMEVAEDFDTP